MSQIDEQLKAIAKADIERIVYSKHDEQFPVFAWLALIVLVLEVFVLNRKNAWLRKINFFTKENKQ